MLRETGRGAPREQNAPPVRRRVVVIALYTPGIEVGAILQRNPEVIRIASQSDEAGASNADDSKRHAFDKQLLTDHAAIVREAPVPVPVT